MSYLQIVNGQPLANDLDCAPQIAGIKQQLSEQLTKENVAQGLKPEQRDHLVELVLHWEARYGLQREDPQFEKLLRIDAIKGGGQRRKFARKVRKALKALDDALAYAHSIRDGLFGATLPYSVVPRLEETKAVLLNTGVEGPDFVRPIPDRLGADEQLFANPRTDATLALMDFFKVCELTQNEASQRTARIGNALGWWDVHTSDHHESHNPNRSRAIERRISRRTDR